MQAARRIELLESWLRAHYRRLLMVFALLAVAVVAWAYPLSRASESRPRLEVVHRGSGGPRPSASPRPPGTSRAAAPAPSPAPGKAPTPRVHKPEAPLATPVTIWVHVAGAVGRPGVVRLPGDARAFEAVRAAGGLQSDADLDRVNLARRVEDGDMLIVPRRGKPVSAPHAVQAAGEVPAPTPEAVPLDLNAATADQLAALPGLGPSRAAAIVEDRARRGPFRTVQDVGRVPGIGPRLIERMAPLLTIGE